MGRRRPERWRVLQQLSDGGFELVLRKPPRMIEANDTLSIQQDVHGYRCHAVLFVIRLTHGDRFVAQEAVGVSRTWRM